MAKPTISIIAAIAGKKRVIGKSGGLPWYLPEELKRFRKLTTGHPVIMGRKTHESIGKPLPNRLNIVITRDKSYQKEEIVVVNSLTDALRYAQGKPGSEEIFIIGGGQIYDQALLLTDKLYLTLVDKEIEGDVFFPDYSDFKYKKEIGKGEHEGITYTFYEFTK